MSVFRLSAILLAALPLAGCLESSRNGYGFPIGIYGVQPGDEFSKIREAGFNAVQSYRGETGEVREVHRAAGKAGLRVLIRPDQFLAAGEVPRDLSPLAWYVADEPDVQRISSSAIKEKSAAVRQWSGGQPTAAVLGDGRRAPTYASSVDVLMVDWYPVPHLPLTSAGDHVRWTVKARENAPVWAVLQTFDWRHYEQRDPKKPRIGRFPTRDEIRFMTYDSIIGGARGIWYYTFRRPDGSTLLDTPELWWAVSSVSRELAVLESILADGERLGPAELLPEGVRSLVIRHGRRRYYLLANCTGADALYPIHYHHDRFNPLFELRREPRENLKNMRGNTFLPPWRVLVLEELRPG